MMRTTPLRLGLTIAVVGALGCQSSRGPATQPDAGAIPLASASAGVQVDVNAPRGADAAPELRVTEPLSSYCSKRGTCPTFDVAVRETKACTRQYERREGALQPKCYAAKVGTCGVFRFTETANPSDFTTTTQTFDASGRLVAACMELLGFGSKCYGARPTCTPRVEYVYPE